MQGPSSSTPGPRPARVVEAAASIAGGSVDHRLAVRRRQRGMTLTEVMVVIGIILIIVSMSFPIITASRERGRTVLCLSNLRSITVALQLYAQAHATYPGQMADLSVALAAHMDRPGLLKCPEDEEAGDDSYSDYYIGRREEDPPSSLVVACPRHFGFRKSLNLYLDASELVSESIVIHKKNVLGTEELPAGDLVTDGELHFGQGASVEVESGTPTLRPLTAYREPDGSVHAVLRVSSEVTSKLSASVSARHTLELVTLTGVTRAGPSDFTLTVAREDVSGIPHDTTEVSVSNGEARLTPTGGSFIRRLPGGFELGSQSDSAYEPASIPAGESATSARPK